MKYIVMFFITIKFTIAYGQVTFNVIPLDKQLVARDLNTNFGEIVVNGEVNNAVVKYDSLLIEVYRNNLVYRTFSQYLNYNDNIAPFDFNIPIVAELVNYSLRIYGKFENSLIFENAVDDIVAGDVYIIQGQSNAEAGIRYGSASEYQNDFIRVYASGTASTKDLVGNNHWYIGQGDGYKKTDGNTGQWGLKLAKSIVESFEIPVAIFNGAHGGREISFFQAPDNYKISPHSNYGRLYYRLVNSGLKDYVRAVYWSQGEQDAKSSVATTTIEYKDAFIALRNSWLLDYRKIEKIYIFQTKKGCGNLFENVMRIKEAQRQLAYENPDILIMSTGAITHHTDNCHFPFTNGYELFADRIFELVQRDMYGIADSEGIEPPMITSVILDNNNLIIETDARNLILNSNTEGFKLINAGAATIQDINVSSSNVILSLSENPGSEATISYYAQSNEPGKIITNQQGLEMLSFNEYPIDNILSDSNEISKNWLTVCPNPTNNSLQVKLLLNENYARIVLIDLTGRIILEQQFNSNNFEINLNQPKGKYLLKIVTQNNVYTENIIIK